MPKKVAAGTTWRPVKVKEATYKKIILIKGTLEQTNKVPVSIGDTIDTIFLAACEELAEKSGKRLPREFYVEANVGQVSTDRL